MRWLWELFWELLWAERMESVLVGLQATARKDRDAPARCGS